MSFCAWEAVCYFGTLLPIAYVDYKSRRIPNKLLCLLLFWRVAFLTQLFVTWGKDALPNLWDSLGAVLITLAATAILFPILHGKTGAGDFKLLLVCGFCLGLDVYLYALCITALLLLVILGIQMAKRQSQRVPFAPFFCLGAVFALIMDYILKA